MIEDTPTPHENQPDQGVPQGPHPTDAGKVEVNESQPKGAESTTIAEKPNTFRKPWVGRKILNKGREWWQATGKAENSNRMVAFATAFIAAATFISTYEIVTGSNDTKRIVTAAEDIKTALNTANSQNQDALDKTLRENRRSLRRTMRQSKKLWIRAMLRAAWH